MGKWLNLFNYQIVIGITSATGILQTRDLLDLPMETRKDYRAEAKNADCVRVRRTNKPHEFWVVKTVYVSLT